MMVGTGAIGFTLCTFLYGHFGPQLPVRQQPSASTASRHARLTRYAACRARYRELSRLTWTL